MQEQEKSMEFSLAFRDADGTYIAHVGAMLISLLSSSPRGMRVHVLHDDSLTEHGKEQLLSLCYTPQQSLHFHHLNPAICLPGVNEASPIMRPLTFATLYRLFLPHMPGLETCPRLIYLDTDLIVDTDLEPLWNFDMGSALLGAVPDPCLRGALTRKGDAHKDKWARDVARYSLNLGIPMGRYFNAGVLLLNMESIRKEKLFEAATEFMLGEPHLLHPDQDALNKIFLGRSVDIPQKFNFLLHSVTVDNEEEGVWHYSGPRKPWHQDMAKAHRYWHYRNRTPWAQE